MRPTATPPNTKCPDCGYEARDSYILKRHVSTHSKCGPCRLSFASSSEALEHKAVCKKFLSKQCPLCSVTFASTEIIEGHLVTQHNTVIEKETLQFNNVEEFRDWKKHIESTQRSNFVTTTTYSSNNKKTVYLKCHRSGNAMVKSDETRLRQLKKRGSHKINAFCPARMHVTIDNDGRTTVNFVATHVGHDFALGRIHLDRQYRAELAAKMAQKVPLDSILDEVREMFKKSSEDVDESELTRSSLLNRKDLHNIARDFKVSKTHIVRHKNDPTSDESWNETAGPKKLSHKRPRRPTIEDVRAKVDEIMASVTNDAQIAALHEHVKSMEALVISLATKPSTSKEISPKKRQRNETFSSIL